MHILVYDEGIEDTETRINAHKNRTCNFKFNRIKFGRF